jgi:Arc/MetJ family transcription regulator
MDEDVLAEARERAGQGELSSYVNEAVRRQLQHDRLGELLAEMEAQAGPVPGEILDEARRVWQGGKRSGRRRPA